MTKVTQLLIGERYLHLPSAGLTARLVGNKIEIAAKAFARQVTVKALNADPIRLEMN